MASRAQTIPDLLSNSRMRTCIICLRCSHACSTPLTHSPILQHARIYRVSGQVGVINRVMLGRGYWCPVRLRVRIRHLKTWHIRPSKYLSLPPPSTHTPTCPPPTRTHTHTHTPMRAVVSGASALSPDHRTSRRASASTTQSLCTRWTCRLRGVSVSVSVCLCVG